METLQAKATLLLLCMFHVSTSLPHPSLLKCCASSCPACPKSLNAKHTSGHIACTFLQVSFQGCLFFINLKVNSLGLQLHTAICR